MAMMRKTITIPGAMEDWVKAQIKSGRYWIKAVAALPNGDDESRFLVIIPVINSIKEG